MLDIDSMANSLPRKRPQNSSPTMLIRSTPYFILLNGWLILIIIMNPTTARSIVPAVAMSSLGRLNTCPQITSAPTDNTSVSPAGNAFNMTFTIKFPSIRFLFGSSASRNPGNPMVNMLMSDICDGSSGYVIANIAENMAISSENIFLTRKRLADLCILLTTCLPSNTTYGIRPKSESRSTVCAACAAASLPDAIAILQSASFIASISFTPSPVMATVCFCFWSALTMSCFCLGVTLPNTVYLSTASVISFSEAKVEAST